MREGADERYSYHGGFLAPDIYYLGAAGSIIVNGIRIAGASGIYKSFDYTQGGWPSLDGATRLDDGRQGTTSGYRTTARRCGAAIIFASMMSFG